MKKAKLIRFENTDQGCFSIVTLPSGTTLYGGELIWNFNTNNISSFPAGVCHFHRVRSASRSKKAREQHAAEIAAQPLEKQEEFAKQFDVYVYEMFDNTPNDGIDDTSGRNNVQIHSGNYCGNINKGYRADVLGCLILGTAFHDGSDGTQKCVLHSVAAMKIFENEMRNPDGTWDILELDVCDNPGNYKPV